MQHNIRKITFGYANNSLNVIHEAVAVFTFGSCLKMHSTAPDLALELECERSLGGSYALLQESLGIAAADGFSGALGSVYVHESEDEGSPKIYIVGLGENAPRNGRIGVGDYQIAVQKLFETVESATNPIALLTVVLPSHNMIGRLRQEVARATAFWAILTLAGPFDTTYSAKRKLPVHDLDLILIVESLGEETTEISEEICEGWRTANAILQERDGLLSSGRTEATAPNREAEAG
jgi:hypothetical protein